jgi:Rieske 2Fe-2S family protein
VIRPPELDSALIAHRDGFALPRSFQLERSIYEYELAAIWRQSWLYAGASAQACRPGAFFRFDLGDDSLVIVRGEDGELHALHNTCRHRGFPVCPERAGTAKRFVCPYHQWSYALDGALLGCGGMEDEIEARDYGLQRAAVAEVGGLVFVWLGPDPQPLGDAQPELGSALRPQGLDRAKVAVEVDYAVCANWKLVWENNRECWHCHAGHPEYIQANFDVAPDTERTRELIAQRTQDHADVLAAGDPLSAEVDHAAPGLYRFPTPGRWWSANRTPLAPGFVTESTDGAPVAPLMGDYAGYDVGTLRARTVPNFWMHASADHAVLTRLAPAGPELTKITVQWLVDEHAVEGRDYDPDTVSAFWRLVSEQDWELCERNHSGVRSPAFTPGPYSTKREYNVIEFMRWYRSRLGA